MWTLWMAPSSRFWNPIVNVLPAGPVTSGVENLVPWAMIVTSVFGGAGVELGTGDGLGMGVAVGVAAGEGLAAAMLAGASVGAALGVGEAELEQAAAASITAAKPARMRLMVIGRSPLWRWGRGWARSIRLCASPVRDCRTSRYGANRQSSCAC